MRLRAFTATTIDEAMRDMRRSLGAGATILSSTALGVGVRVVAAEARRPTGDRTRGFFTALAAHGVPAEMIERLRAIPGTPEEALCALLPFASLGDRPLLLVGPPGAGKTLSVARLAARAVFGKQCVAVMTTDDERAGGVEELERLTGVLGLELTRVSPSTIHAAILAHGPGVIIDSAATNPFDSDDLVRLAGLIAASRADPVVVLPAGIDPGEAADMAHAFAALGATHMIVTRLDASRHWGGLFAAASAGLALGVAGVAPRVAHGLIDLTPDLVARAIVDAGAIRPSTIEVAP